MIPYSKTPARNLIKTSKHQTVGWHNICRSSEQWILLIARQKPPSLSYSWNVLPSLAPGITNSDLPEYLNIPGVFTLYILTYKNRYFECYNSITLYLQYLKRACVNLTEFKRGCTLFFPPDYWEIRGAQDSLSYMEFIGMYISFVEVF